LRVDYSVKGCRTGRRFAEGWFQDEQLDNAKRVRLPQNRQKDGATRAAPLANHVGLTLKYNCGREAERRADSFKDPGQRDAAAR